MSTAIDTNVIVALWDEEGSLHRMAREMLDAALERGALVISGVVYAELIAAPRRTEAFVDGFCEATGIRVEWELGEEAWRAAGAAYQSHAARRKKNKAGEPRRILADFLIGAHALANRHRLLTLDAQVYRTSFARLAVESV